MFLLHDRTIAYFVRRVKNDGGSRDVGGRSHVWVMDLLPYVVDLMLEVADLNFKVLDLRSSLL